MMEHYTAAAELGSGLGLWALGQCHEKCLGVQSDIVKALGFYQQGADKGDANI
jgi:TPR repeat protein